MATSVVFGVGTARQSGQDDTPDATGRASTAAAWLLTICAKSVVIGLFLVEFFCRLAGSANHDRFRRSIDLSATDRVSVGSRSVDLRPAPPESRTFSSVDRVRLGDVSPRGRLRLDGIAKLLQDVATDDAEDGAPDADEGWVVRRTTIDVTEWPRHREVLTVTTWCSGYGRRWAQRRTSLVGDRGGLVEAESLWIHVDRATGRPTPLGPTFFEVWGPGVTDTSVSARRRLPDEPVGEHRPWPLRFSDFDALRHVNNAAYWLPVEEQLAAREDLTAPLRAELEYREGVVRDESVDVVTQDEGDGFLQWWVVDGLVRASARVRR
jgi:acyl-ACP thioesterase